MYQRGIFASNSYGVTLELLTDGLTLSASFVPWLGGASSKSTDLES